MKNDKYGNWVSAGYCYFNVTSKQNSACIFHAGELMGGMLPICMSKPVKAQQWVAFEWESACIQQSLQLPLQWHHSTLSHHQYHSCAHVWKTKINKLTQFSANDQALRSLLWRPQDLACYRHSMCVFYSL